MPAPRTDPYNTLGVSPDASDDLVRSVYRRLVQLHHPDHNGGSAEATRRFEEIQEAYAQVTRLRKLAPHDQQTQAREPADPEVESRLADIERQVREAHTARERARREAREAAAQTERRPSDEELGYVTTDDSFSKVLADARREIAEQFAEGKRHPTVKRVADLIDDLASKLGGEGSGRSGDKR